MLLKLPESSKSSNFLKLQKLLESFFKFCFFLMVSSVVSFNLSYPFLIFIISTHAYYRAEKQALRKTNQELMDRLKKLWNCYKEKSLDRLGNSMSSDSSASANKNVDDVKVVNHLCKFLTNCVLFSFFLSFSNLSNSPKNFPHLKI
jgi:hypothetical protein